MSGFTQNAQAPSTQVCFWVLSIIFVLFFSVAAFAAPKSASTYYSDAAFQYIENRLPSAEITCNEGLQYYPNDQKLQMLLDRIHEAKDEQKNENKKNDKNENQNKDESQNQDKDQDQGENKDQGQNQQNNDDQSGESSSSGQDQNQQNQGENSESSSSTSESSDSQGGADEQPESPDAGSSESQGEEPQEQPVQMGEMTPEEANQLLKDFDEQSGERKPWKPIRGQVRPAKDW